jgi:hypothetical protein
MRKNWQWDDVVFHAQIEVEIATMRAATIRNQHGIPELFMVLRLWLISGKKIWRNQSAKGSRSMNPFAWWRCNNCDLTSPTI